MYSQPYFYHYNPYYFEQLRAPIDRQLVNDIQRAINGEFSAIACYEKLAKMAPTQEERKQIQEIRQDERRHFEEFSRIYTNLTGRQPTPKISEKCPNSYLKGIDVAFKDEQETVDFYLDIAEKTEDMQIKETFRRASADEQNHAVWFLYFLQKAQK